jgi:hypothetical protein
LAIGMFLTVWLATGSARFWFGARAELGREKRPAALSSYACAPLCLLPISAVTVTGLLAIRLFQPGPGKSFWMLGAALAVIGAIVTLFCLIAWWLGTLQLLFRTTACGWPRLIAAGILLPIGWAVAAVVGLGVWPCLAGLIWLGIDSLRK